MHGLLGARFIATIMISAVLAGCIDTDLVPPRIQGFEATLEGDHGSSWFVSLSGPVEIMGRDGIERPAWLLRTDGPSRTDQYFYLDGLLRVVRSDSHCLGIEETCEHYTSRNFGYTGAPDPFGISLVHSEPGSLIDWSSREAVPVEVRVQNDVFDLPQDHGPLFAGEYQKHADRLLPDGPRGRVIEYVETGPLPPVPPWPVEVTEAPPSGAGVGIFPGWDTEEFGSSFTTKDLLDALAAEDADAARMLRDGCMHALRVMPREPRGTPLDSDRFDARPPTEAEIGLSDGDGATPLLWTVEADRDWFGNPEYEVSAPAPLETKATCAEMARGPHPVISLGAASAQAETLGIAKQGFEAYYVNFRSGADNRPPETGWTRYAFYYTPAYVDLNQSIVAYQWYSVSIDPNTGWFLYVLASPEDLAPKPVT